jgi:hypothetical protein
MLYSLLKEIFSINELILEALLAHFKGYLLNSTLATSAILRPSLTTHRRGKHLSYRYRRYYNRL